MYNYFVSFFFLSLFYPLHLVLNITSEVELRNRTLLLLIRSRTLTNKSNQCLFLQIRTDIECNHMPNLLTRCLQRLKRLKS
ncbi:transmembrane protein, putative [Medicago truncatula]|uniref:Transmembrane protein, putative n=1 Tax=Medicago truncatula TaxID=3880 RepID=A0A072TQ32_MEDTR|nr:transmembrane protein, putative [Medicago truncatula]